MTCRKTNGPFSTISNRKPSERFIK